MPDPKKVPLAWGPDSPSSSSSLTRQEIRDKALQGVVDRISRTEGSGRLKGRTAVITGVGPELAIGHLYLLDVTDRHMKTLVDRLKKDYSAVKVTMVTADAASPRAIQDIVTRAVRETGRLDIFFANAGISQILPPDKPRTGDDAVQAHLEELKKTNRGFGDIGEEEFMEVMRINALGPFLAIKYASEAMSKTDGAKPIPGGSIILTASGMCLGVVKLMEVAGLKANAGPPPYSASKAAVVSLAQTAAFALTGTNIRVNAICPGLIQTDMTRSAFALAKYAGKDSKMGIINPLLRQGLGEEVAQMALFLASDESSYVNGQALPVDGGLTASMPYIRSKL